MRFDSLRHRHPDRTELLAWSEGELTWWRTRMVSRHVRSCWQCKAQVSELDTMVRTVAQGIDQLPEPSRVDIAKAYWRFRQACQELDAAPQPRTLRLRPVWAILAAAILATGGLAYVTTHYRRQQSAGNPVAMPPAPKTRATDASSQALVAPVRKDAPMAVAPSRPPQFEEVRIPRLPPGPTEEDLLAVEIQALAALHRSRFCLNSGIGVRAVGPAVEVSGFVQSRDQRDRLTWLLQGIGSGILQLRLTDPAEAAGNAPSTIDIAPAPGRGKRIAPPIESWLRQSLQVGSRMTEREMFNLMNAVVLESESVSSEAWAIRHLAEQFPPARTLRLSAEPASQLLQMVDDHAIALANSLRTLRGRLHRVLGTPPPRSSEPLASAPDDPWQKKVAGLQQCSEGVVSRLLESFSATTGTANPDNAGAPRDFSALLSLLDGESGDCMEVTAGLRASIQRESAMRAAMR